MKNIDYKANIRFILENFEDLNLANKDLITLQRTLSFLKLQVQQQIIEQQVLGNEDLQEQIRETQKHLNERIVNLTETLNTYEQQARYPEYKAKSRDEGIADSLYDDIEIKRKSKYDEDKEVFERKTKPELENKIMIFQEMVERLQGLVLTLDNPQQFIGQVISTDNSQEYNRLMNICATNMADSYMTMESYGKNPLFFKTTDGNIERYVPNPKAINGFLDLIRNPELVEELSAYNKILSQSREDEKALERVQTEEEQLINFDKSLSPSAYNFKCVQVEELINRIAQMNRNITRARKDAKEHMMLMKTNVFQKILNTILGKYSRANIRHKQLLHKIDVFENSLRKLRTDNEFVKIIESDTYGRYLDAVLSTLKDGQESISPEEILASKGDDMRSFVREANLQKMKKAHQMVEDAQSKLEQSKAMVSKQYAALTSKAQELVDNGVGIYGLQSKYINRTESDRYGVSPFVASLILETLIKDKGITTVDELKEFGVVLSAEQITNHGKDIEEAIQKITQELQSYEKAGEDLEATR